MPELISSAGENKALVDSASCHWTVLSQPVEDGFFYNAPRLQMLDDDALEELRCDARVPYTFWIDHNDGTSCAHAKTGRFTSLHPVRPEKKSLSLEQRREQRVQRAPATVRRTESSRADQHMT